MFSPLLALIILNALIFSSKAYFRNKFGVRDDLLIKGEFEFRIGIAACCVGPMSSLISTTPFELIKIKVVKNCITTQNQHLHRF